MPRASLFALCLALLPSCGGSKPDAEAPTSTKKEAPCDASAASHCDAERNVCEKPVTMDQPRMQDCEAQYQACMRKAGC